jgi:hypothetical protein
MIYESRRTKDGRIKPPRVVRRLPAGRGRRLAAALGLVAVITSVLGVVAILGSVGGPTA